VCQHFSTMLCLMVSMNYSSFLKHARFTTKTEPDLSTMLFNYLYSLINFFGNSSILNILSSADIKLVIRIGINDISEKHQVCNKKGDNQ
jgi:hypothetical protein